VFACFLVAAGVSAPVEEIALVPSVDLTLVKSFETTSETERSSESPRGESSSNSTGTRTLVVTDVTESTEDERVTKLLRTFDEVAAETETETYMGDRSREISSTGTSDLEGETVLFEWDEDDEEYEASSEDVDGDILEDLVYDYDFAALLPDDEVEPDDEWAVDVDDFLAMIDPWDSLAMDWQTEDSRGSSTDEQEPDVEETSEGEVVAIYEGTREVDGTEVAVLRLLGEITTDRVVDATREFEHGVSTSHTESSENRTVEGEALWNIEGGHLHSIELEMEVSTSGTTASSFEMDGREFANESEFELSGNVTFEALFEAAD
jgi:hypothetical protein